ncbi:hypothetical protein BYT27DRAFT_7174067 [Phlegmacium glaucopus]|nr:hypothetical protein BYT27DRAFT_7174067 [Phlegmacium glaucopus]
MSAINANPTSSEGSRKSSHCNNMSGKNQYKNRPAPDDPRVSELLRDYHCKGITDKTQVRKLLLEEHGVILSESSISRRKRKLGLKASHLTTLELNVTVKRQLILDQMAKDPKGRLGARMVKQGILRDGGIHLTRDYIREEMMKLDPAAHAARGPAHVKAKRQRKHLAAPDSLISGSIEPSEVHTNLSFTPSSTQAVPLDLPSASIPIFQLRPTPLSPVLHSAVMDVDEDSDSSGIDSHINSSHAEIPHQPNILPSNPHPPPRPFHAVTPSITVALGILRDIAPQMGALTRILDSLNIDEEVLDAQAHSLVAGGMEAAALLERQLARVASRTYRP